MSVSSIGGISESMAAAVSVAQSQALQYAAYFRQIVLSVESADLEGATNALSSFGRVSAMAAASGFDPVNQVPSLAKEFVGIRKALAKGDIRSAQNSLSNLKRELGVVTSVQPPDIAVSPEQTPALIDDAESALSLRNAELIRRATPLKQAPIGIGLDTERSSSVKAAQTAAKTAKTGDTQIKMDPELASFSQVPRVFPTSSASSFSPVVTSSIQLVAQSSAAIYADSVDAGAIGTAFAPLPEMMLGSRGMSIPDGALLEFGDQQLIPTTLAFGR